MTTGIDPAFPFVVDDLSKNQCTLSGLTKREYFAAMAMQGILSGPCSRDGVPSREWLDAARESVKVADALIDALSQETGGDRG